MMRAFLTLAAVATTAATLTGCDSGPSSYATPTTYGSAGHCYYIDDPREVTALQRAGRCPVNWTPMRAPLAYRDAYATYWSSPAYVDTYVPATVRKTYITHVTTYNTQRAPQIRVAEARAANASRVRVSSSRTTYRSGDRSWSSYSSRSWYGGGSRVSVGSSTRSFSSGSRR